MAQSPTITDLTDATFHRDVIQHTGPVLLEFVSEWSGACHILAPVLEALASEFGGRVMLCRMDVDAQPRTASEHGIQSVPTILLFVDGRVVDHLVGTTPRAELRTRLLALLEKDF